MIMPHTILPFLFCNCQLQQKPFHSSNLRTEGCYSDREFIDMLFLHHNRRAGRLRQVFHRKLTASRCIPHSTLSLASGQASKNLESSQGHQRGGEERIWLAGPSELYRNSPQGLNISSIRVFLPDQRSVNSNHP